MIEHPDRCLRRFGRRAAVLGMVALAAAAIALFAAVLAADPPAEPFDAGRSERDEAEDRDAVADLARADRVDRAPVDRGHRPRAPGPYSAPGGSRLWFRCHLRSCTVTATEDHSDRGELSFEVRGRLRLDVRARRGEELAVALCFAEVEAKVTSTGPARTEPDAVRALERDLEREVLVRMDRRGRVLGWRFPAEIELENRLWFRTAVASWFFELRRPRSERSWSMVRPASSGIVALDARWATAPAAERPGRAIYEVSGFRGADGDDGYLPDVQGGGRLFHDARLGWPARGSFAETMDLRVPQLGEVSQRNEGSYRLESAERRAPSEAFPWHQPWTSPDPRADLAAAQERRDRERWSARLAGVSVDELFARLLIGAQDGWGPGRMAELRTALEWALRLDPEALDQLRRHLVDPGTPPRALNAGLSAVARVGSPRCQELLAGLLGDRRMTVDARRAVARAAAAVVEPDAALGVGVLRVVDDGGTPPGLRANALLALGVIASREEFVPTDQRIDAVGALLARRAEAEDQGLLTTWLEAIGNTESDRALPHAQSYLAHPDAAVRRAAVSALRAVQTERADALLFESARTDRSALVRLRAVQLLGRRSRDGLSESLASIAEADPEPGVRGAAIESLQGRQFGAAVAERLRRIAENDASEEVRSIAGRVASRAR